MKLQNLTVIFIIIIIPIILIISLYITTGLKTIKYQSLYDEGLLNATHDAIYAFELNTANDELSENPEIKRSIIKSSIKMFERSLANTCGISAYNAKDIEEYIPAIVFGMYDGFYMYAPSVIYNGTTKEYNHNLKNYVYYSEKLDDNGTTIIYSLDNYVVISGIFNGKYQTKEGYLIDLTDTNENGERYKGITINKETIGGIENTDAINYYKEAYKFTEWFNENIGNNIKDENNKKYLYIDEDNNPEDENSLFVQHKRKIIKNKIESVLNSSITSYSERTWSKVYKMPKLTVEDWEKVYSNISMITFFQGKSIGLTKYNGYCVLNSTNNKEYVNPNLMYFIDNTGYYHDIRCEKCKEATFLTGYKVGDFAKRKVETTDGKGKTTTNYIYDHNELACYYCVNGQINSYESIQNYVSETEEVKTAYWTSLARERYDTPKLLDTTESLGQIEESSGEKEKITWTKTSTGDLAIGSTVKTSTNEEFYVIGFAGTNNETVKLLAKNNLKTDGSAQDQTGALNRCTFCTATAWNGASVAANDDLNTKATIKEDTTSAVYKAIKYGETLGATGRLMLKSEAETLKSANSDILYGKNEKSSGTYLNYWLGSASYSSLVWRVVGNGSDLNIRDYNRGNYCGVRPVVEILKSTIS